MAATTQHQKLTSKGVIGMMLMELGNPNATSWARREGMYIPSNQDLETYAWLGTPPALREWVGEREAKGLTEKEFAVRNKVFEATLKIAKDDMRQDKTGIVQRRIRDLVRRADDHWEKLVSDAYNSGTTTNCYDGKKLFAANHVEGKSGTQSNLLTSSDYASLNISTVATPTAVEVANALIDVVSHFHTLKDDSGEPIHTGQALSVDVHVSTASKYYTPFYKAISSDNLQNGAGSVFDNPIKGGPYLFNLINNARLTVTDGFYVTLADKDAGAFILQEHSDIEISAIAEGSEYEFDNREHKYGLEAKRAVAPGYWQNTLKATFS